MALYLSLRFQNTFRKHEFADGLITHSVEYAGSNANGPLCLSFYFFRFPFSFFRLFFLFPFFLLSREPRLIANTKWPVHDQWN